MQKDSVGALMDFNMIHVRDDVTLEVVSRYLRRFDELPDHTDQVFVVDRDDRFKGVLPINLIVVNEPEVIVSNLMLTDTIQLDPEEKAEQAAQAFERYDLVSAPVVDEDGKLVGRVTVNVVLDFIRDRIGKRPAESGRLARGRRYFRLGVEERAKPLDVAGAESLHRIFCFARDRQLSRAPSQNSSRWPR